MERFFEILDFLQIPPGFIAYLLALALGGLLILMLGTVNLVCRMTTLFYFFYRNPEKLKECECLDKRKRIFRHITQMTRVTEDILLLLITLFITAWCAYGALMSAWHAYGSIFIS